MSQILVRKPAKVAPPPKRIERPSLLVDRYGNPLASVKRVKGQSRSKRKIISRNTPIVRVVRDFSHLSLGTEHNLRSGGHGRSSHHGYRSLVPFTTKQASQPIPGPGLTWNSDFSFGTGTGTTATHDGAGGTAKWASDSGTGVATLLNVMSATGLGFPSDMTNVLRVELPATEVSALVRTGKGKWASPAAGQSIWYRYYLRTDFSNGFDLGSMHPVQADSPASTAPDNSPGNLKWEWKFISVAGGQLTFRWEFEPFVTNYPHNAFDLSNTGGAVWNVNTVYRVEWQLQRSGGGTTCKVFLRIYNSSNTLIASNTDFINGAGTTLAVDNPDLNLGSDPDAEFQDVLCGNNGPILGTRNHSEYYYYGGWGVSLSDWCGPYSATRG